MNNFQNGQLLPAEPDSEVYEAIRTALAEARTKVFAAVNMAMVGVYWEIGRKITEAVGERAVTNSARSASRIDLGALPNAHALRAQLTWTHYRMLIRTDEKVL